MDKAPRPVVIRPRSIIIDDDVVRSLIGVRKAPAATQSLPPAAAAAPAAAAPLPLAQASTNPPPTRSLVDVMAQVAHGSVPPLIDTANSVKQSQDTSRGGGGNSGGGGNDAMGKETTTAAAAVEEEDEEEKFTALPDNGVYEIITDMARFLEDESTEQRNINRMRTLIGSIRASSDIVSRLRRAPHTEKNWELAGIVFDKVTEHLANLSMELDSAVAFTMRRALNIERLVQRGTAVAAGATPTVSVEQADVNNDSYLFHFRNDTLAPYATDERLVLSSFETSQS